jgi:hypothetical protein
MLKTDNITITPDVLALIAQIDEFKGAWRALGSLAPERLLALRRIATIESVASSTRIEGSKLSNAEVDALLSNIKVKKFATRDEQEVAGYAEVMELLFASWEHIPFNENHIQQLHRDLLQYSDKDAHHRGRYKKSPTMSRPSMRRANRWLWSSRPLNRLTRHASCKSWSSGYAMPAKTKPCIRF